MEELKQNPQDSDIDLKEILFGYLRYWPFIILTPLIALSLAFIYLRYTPKTYSSAATILIKDEKSGGISELAALEDLGLGGGSLSKSVFENEIELLKSRRLLGEVVDKLNLRIRYFKQGQIINSEVFGNTPFKVQILTASDSLAEFVGHYYLKGVSNTDFALSTEEGVKGENFKYGERIELKNHAITILPYAQKTATMIGENYEIFIGSYDTAVTNLRRGIKVQQLGKSSSVLQLELTSSNTYKSEAILNTLIELYNEDAIDDRNQVSQSTARFIENRLAIITTELDSVEIGKVTFRENNNIVDIAAEGEMFLQKESEVSRAQMDVAIQLELLNNVENYLEQGGSDELIPTNLGLEAGNSSSAIQDYNALVIEKKQLLQSATDKNPVVIALDDQISDLRGTILSNLENAQASLQLRNRDIIAQRGALRSKLSRIPRISKSSRAIERQQRIKEELYLYLLQKREETAISLAITAPKAKIVDYAHTSRSPVSPKNNIIYLGALALGFILPVGLIYIKTLLDTKIHNRLDVERAVTSLPILGEVPTVDSKESETITSNDRSVLAEAFRILRTNLGYFINSKAEDTNNVIFVTSTVKGEGKTFVAYNLALTLTSTGKSVLLVGADIRNPQLHRYIDKDKWSIGLSEHLYDPEVTRETLINEVYSDKERFDIILSGRIPPNPAELLMNGRFDQLVEDVRNDYDYVIIDTAPTLLVTDTLLISQKADMTVYVCRAEYTDKKLLQYPKELVEEGKLKNVAFAINGIKITNFGYGSKYGYGYGYGQDKASLSQRIKKRLGF